MYKNIHLMLDCAANDLNMAARYGLDSQAYAEQKGFYNTLVDAHNGLYSRILRSLVAQSSIKCANVQYDLDHTVVLDAYCVGVRRACRQLLEEI